MESKHRGVWSGTGVSRFPFGMACKLLVLACAFSAPTAIADPAPRVGCPGPITVTHTDADFDVGLYTLQQGFGEDEIFAAQYFVDAADFPITLRTIDFLIGQEGTNESTETEYSILVWDGPPNGGLLVGQFFSGEGEDLPNVIMPAGELPRATLVNFVVNPEDPIQVQILNNSGTNSFTVGVRIDHHSAPSPAPCSEAPASNLNAFPVVDTSGVDAPTQNWLFALNCGLFACPAGWNVFEGYLCEPSGDWVIRASYECEGELEPWACCGIDGQCSELLESTCNLADGIFFDGQTCDQVTCPDPVGACCAFDTCVSGQSEAACIGFTGVYLGDGTDCTTDVCTPGACCLNDGTCDVMIESACADVGGLFRGVDTDCASADCPQPNGACCFGSVCVDFQQQETCEAGGTGVWAGPATTCACNPCRTILDADPPSGTIDARQPHEVDDATARLGIGSIDEPILVVIGEAGLEDCFALCETAVDPLLGPNAVDSVVDTAVGFYQITLDHPITAGAVTTIQYTGDGSYVEYIAHPANADADTASAPADILKIIDMINGVTFPPHGIYSQDIDHDGTLAPADILRTIDLLNGAGAFDVWLNSLAPQNTGCP